METNSPPEEGGFAWNTKKNLYRNSSIWTRPAPSFGKTCNGKSKPAPTKRNRSSLPARKCGKMFPSAAASTMRSRHIRHSNPSRRNPAGMTLPTSGSTTTGRRWILRTLQESTSPNRALSPPPPSASTSVCSLFRTKTPMNLTSTTGAHRLPACSTATKPVRWNIRHLPASSAALYRSNGSLKLKKALSTTSSTLT